MAKLYNINGFWNMSKKPEFNDNDMWQGQLLLEDDGWFEGIVVDKGSEQEDRFVFGVYGPEKGIELHKLVPLELSDPIIFHGKNNGKGYAGTFEAIHLLGTTPIGTSLINTEESFSENYEGEVKALSDRIQKFKDTTLKISAKDLYENSINMRRVICLIHLGNFEGKVYTRSEINELLAESKPVTEKVIEETAKDINMSVEDTKKLMLKDEKGTTIGDFFEI